MLERNDTILRKKMKQYILPGIMLTAALQIGNVVDTMLVGNLLGPDAMSAAKIGMTVDNIVELPGHVLGVGGGIAAGILMGNREAGKAKKVFSVTMFISMICGFIFAALSGFSGQIAAWLCGSSSLVKDAEKFIFVTMLIAPIFSAGLQLISYVAVDNHPQLASAYVITANVINLTMDYILLKYTSLGTAGAALSTGIGYGAALFLMIFYVKSKKRLLSFVNPFRDFMANFLSAVKAGIPTLLFMICLTVKDIFLNSIILTMAGNLAMVLYTVSFNMTLCVQIFAGGIVGLFSSMGSVMYGKNDFFGLKKLIGYLSRYSYTILGVFMLFMMIKPEIFLGLFGVKGAESLTVGATAMRIFALSLPFYLWNQFMTAYYQSTNKTVLSSLITSLQTCVAIVPLAYVLIRFSGNLGLSSINAMVLAFVFSEFLTILIAFLYQRIKYHGQNYFLIPDRKNNTVEFTVSNQPPQVSEMVDMIFDFCKKQKISQKTANRMSVVIEEILDHVFRFGNAGNADIALEVTDGSLYLRSTDDGIMLNPLEYSQEKDEVWPEEVETILSIADKVEYLRVIDLNYTTIKVDVQKLTD